MPLGDILKSKGKGKKADTSERNPLYGPAPALTQRQAKFQGPVQISNARKEQLQHGINVRDDQLWTDFEGLSFLRGPPKWQDEAVTFLETSVIKSWVQGEKSCVTVIYAFDEFDFEHPITSLTWFAAMLAITLDPKGLDKPPNYPGFVKALELQRKGNEIVLTYFSDAHTEERDPLACRCGILRMMCEQLATGGGKDLDISFAEDEIPPKDRPTGKKYYGYCLWMFTKLLEAAAKIDRSVICIIEVGRLTNSAAYGDMVQLVKTLKVLVRDVKARDTRSPFFFKVLVINSNNLLKPLDPHQQGLVRPDGERPVNTMQARVYDLLKRTID